tara:strand:- start:399 stop:2639 length:2241 start_codon:yes stop_codon:yes gene_type:complete
MSETITPQGTTRTTFSIATNDLVINGDVIAGGFIGSGGKITDLNINNVKTGNPLSKLFGGTNNSDYNDEGIVFNNNSENKLSSSSLLRWDNQENILYINNKNIVQDSSNYIEYTSNYLLNNIHETSNIIIENILDHIEQTLGIDNVNGIPIASSTKAGTIKVGDGLFISGEGFLSINPETIEIKVPIIIPQLPLLNLYQTKFNSIYKKYILNYNPNRGTRFDIDISLNDIGTKLPFWYKFNEIIDIDGGRTISNTGNTSALSTANSQNTNLILHGNATILPVNNDELIYEYTPLKNKYLDLDGEYGTYAEFNDSCDIKKIYNTGELGGDVVGLTFAFWFKCSNPENSKTFIIYGNNNFSDYVNIYINNNNKLVVNIFNFGKTEYEISQYNLFDGIWNHFCWSIDDVGKWEIYINGIKEPDITVYKIINLSISYDVRYIGRSRFDDTDNTLAFSMSDYRIYNCVLTTDEVIELYNSNNYTEYDITYYDESSKMSDAIVIGAGGGGNVNGGGGAGKIVFIENANILTGTFKIRVGRGGSGQNTTQNSSSGNNTTLHTIEADGGGSFDDIGGLGGSGSGNGGTNTDNYTDSLSVFNTNNIHFLGNNGYILKGGGGGAGTDGFINNGGNGSFGINTSIVNVNFKEYFDLPIDNSVGYYNSDDDKLYLAGGGSSNIYDENIRYYGYGGGWYNNKSAVGGDGIVILRFIYEFIEDINIPESVLDTSNYVLNTSNNLMSQLHSLISRIEALET